MRIILDAIQLYYSVQFNNQDPSNVGSSLWVWKSTISTGNDLITFMDNINSVTGDYSGLPAQVPLEAAQSGLTFHQLTLIERVMTQIIGAAGFILIVGFDQSLITSNEMLPLTIFGSLYIVQRLAKVGLYGYRFVNPQSTNKRVEQGLYVFSIICNLGQMLTVI